MDASVSKAASLLYNNVMSVPGGNAVKSGDKTENPRTAIVINLDPQNKPESMGVYHQEVAEKAANFFLKNGYDRVNILSFNRPKNSKAQFSPLSIKNLENAVKAQARTLKDGGDFVLIVTGHGGYDLEAGGTSFDMGKHGELTTGDLNKALNHLPYLTNQTIILTPCNSGPAVKPLSKAHRMVVATSGLPAEESISGFIEKLVNNNFDYNQDGVTTYQEAGMGLFSPEENNVGLTISIGSAYENKPLQKQPGAEEKPLYQPKALMAGSMQEFQQHIDRNKGGFTVVLLDKQEKPPSEAGFYTGSFQTLSLDRKAEWAKELLAPFADDGKIEALIIQGDTITPVNSLGNLGYYLSETISGNSLTLYPSPKRLSKLLSYPMPFIRKRAAMRLAWLNKHGRLPEKDLKAALPMIEKMALSDPKTDCRITAISTLGKLARPETKDTLIKLLDSEDLTIKMDSAFYLEELSASESVSSEEKTLISQKLKEYYQKILQAPDQDPDLKDWAEKNLKHLDKKTGR